MRWVNVSWKGSARRTTSARGARRGTRSSDWVRQTFCFPLAFAIVADTCHAIRLAIARGADRHRSDKLLAISSPSPRHLPVSRVACASASSSPAPRHPAQPKRVPYLGALRRRTVVPMFQTSAGWARPSLQVCTSTVSNRSTGVPVFLVRCVADVLRTGHKYNAMSERELEPATPQQQGGTPPPRIAEVQSSTVGPRGGGDGGGARSGWSLGARSGRRAGQRRWALH